MKKSDKVKMVHDLFKKIFAAKSPSDLCDMAYRTGIFGGNEDIIEMVSFKPFKNGKGLRGFIGQSGEVKDLLILEQNPGKGTWCARLASDGLQCAWVMRNGSYLSFLFRRGLGDNDEIHIVRANPANRKALEIKVNEILLASNYHDTGIL